MKGYEMAITSAEIHNQSFSIDSKGYDVDEVDVFLEHVADEIDALNEQIASLQGQVSDDAFAGFDRPAVIEEEEPAQPEPTPAPAAPAIDESVLAEKDARIAELERQLEAKKADDNAIAQALIIAQRSADEILAKANNTAAETIQDAKDEAQRIIDRANNDKQDVIDAIRKLEDDREDAREEYQELLTDFINDASRKLAEIGGGSQASVAAAHYADTTDATAQVQVPMNAEPVAYSTPQTGNVAVAAATPMPSAVEKDLSGFGDADDDFSFDELD